MPLIQPPRVGETMTATGRVRTVESHRDGIGLRVTLDVEIDRGDLAELVHACGRGCVACAAHDPRDRRDHGHLSASMCDACQAEAVPDDDILAAAGLDGLQLLDPERRISWEHVARTALEEIARRDTLDARKRAHESATIVQGPHAQRVAASAPTHGGACRHGRPEGVRCSECSPT